MWISTNGVDSFTRSTTPTKGQRAEVLETKNEVSNDYSMKIRASAQGLYEVVSIRDRYCAFPTQREDKRPAQKLLKNFL